MGIPLQRQGARISARLRNATKAQQLQQKTQSRLRSAARKCAVCHRANEGTLRTYLVAKIFEVLHSIPSIEACTICDPAEFLSQLTEFTMYDG